MEAWVKKEGGIGVREQDKQNTDVKLFVGNYKEKACAFVGGVRKSFYLGSYSAERPLLALELAPNVGSKPATGATTVRAANREKHFIFRDFVGICKVRHF